MWKTVFKSILEYFASFEVSWISGFAFLYFFKFFTLFCDCFQSRGVPGIKWVELTTIFPKKLHLRCLSKFWIRLCNEFNVLKINYKNDSTQRDPTLLSGSVRIPYTLSATWWCVNDGHLYLIKNLVRLFCFCVNPFEHFDISLSWFTF